MTNSSFGNAQIQGNETENIVAQLNFGPIPFTLLIGSVLKNFIIQVMLELL
jgi:hypothetical protein